MKKKEFLIFYATKMEKDIYLDIKSENN